MNMILTVYRNFVYLKLYFHLSYQLIQFFSFFLDDSYVFCTQIFIQIMKFLNNILTYFIAHKIRRKNKIVI